MNQTDSTHVVCCTTYSWICIEKILFPLLVSLITFFLGYYFATRKDKSATNLKLLLSELEAFMKTLESLFEKDFENSQEFTNKNKRCLLAMKKRCSNEKHLLFKCLNQYSIKYNQEEIVKRHDALNNVLTNDTFTEEHFYVPDAIALDKSIIDYFYFLKEIKHNIIEKFS